MNGLDWICLITLIGVIIFGDDKMKKEECDR